MLKLKGKPENIEFIILGEGKNTHFVIPFLKSKVKIGKQIYEAKRENLFVRKDFLKAKRFIAVFKEDGTAITLAKQGVQVTYTNKDGIKKTVTEYNDKVTAETLYIAERSRSLTNGLSEMFSTHLNTKKILFFVAIGAVGVFVYMLISGGLTI